MASISHLLDSDLSQLSNNATQWGQLSGCSLSIAITELSRASNKPLVVITADTHTASQLSEEISFFLAQGCAQYVALSRLGNATLRPFFSP